MPHWQHHLSSVYQPVFNSTPNMCGTDWEQLVLSSLFPWQLKILLYSKILSCYFYPPFFLLSGYIFPLKKAMGLISWTSPSAFIYSWSYLSVATHEKNTRDIFVHLQKWKTSLLTAVPNRISQWICHGLKCGPGTHAGTANPDGTPFWCLKKTVSRRTWQQQGRKEYGLGPKLSLLLTLANKTFRAPKHDTQSTALWGRLYNWFKSLQLTKLTASQRNFLINIWN